MTQAETYETLTRLTGLPIRSPMDEAKAVSGTLKPVLLQRLIERGYRANALEWIVPPRTLARRKAEEALTVDESAKLMRIMKIHAFATEVFGDEGNALAWLNSPKTRLEGQTPVEMAQTEQGAAVVTDLLGRIQSGFFA